MAVNTDELNTLYRGLPPQQAAVLEMLGFGNPGASQAPPQAISPDVLAKLQAEDRARELEQKRARSLSLALQLAGTALGAPGSGQLPQAPQQARAGLRAALAGRAGVDPSAFSGLSPEQAVSVSGALQRPDQGRLNLDRARVARDLLQQRNMNFRAVLANQVRAQIAQLNYEVGIGRISQDEAESKRAALTNYLRELDVGFIQPPPEPRTGLMSIFGQPADPQFAARQQMINLTAAQFRAGTLDADLATNILRAQGVPDDQIAQILGARPQQRQQGAPAPQAPPQGAADPADVQLLDDYIEGLQRGQ